MSSENAIHVVAVVPAHNEESTIGKTVADLLVQTRKVDAIIVVADNCTDATVDLARRFQETFPTVYFLETVENNARKAGAVNQLLERIEGDWVDYILFVDADSCVSRCLVEDAVAYLNEHPEAGGVCSKAGVLDFDVATGSWWKKAVARLLWRLQRLEYAGFDAERTATHANVLVLHGLCAMYRWEALKDVGGYTENHLIEDYDLTLKLKESGWRTCFNPNMRAWTAVPMTVGSFLRQRLRWYRGGVDVLLDHGISKYTVEDFLQHLLFVVLLLSVLIVVSLRTFYGGGVLRFRFQLLPVTLVAVTYLVSLYNLKFVEGLGVVDVLLRVVVIPELLLALVLSCIQLYAYFLAVFRRPQRW